MLVCSAEGLLVLAALLAQACGMTSFSSCQCIPQGFSLRAACPDALKHGRCNITNDT